MSGNPVDLPGEPGNGTGGSRDRHGGADRRDRAEHRRRTGGGRRGAVPDGHVDAWNHIECLMAMTVAGLTAEARHGYDWLLRRQRDDGSWPMKTVRGEAVETSGESNHAAYVAVGVWHEFLVTGDEDFARSMWPVVTKALDFVV